MHQTSVREEWYSVNQRLLIGAVDLVKLELKNYRSNLGEAEDFNYEGERQKLVEQYHSASSQLSVPSPLETLCTAFGLTEFERDILLLAVGIELDSEFDALVKTLQGGNDFSMPTFSLALAVFPHAHWNGIIPTAPLRYWRLISVSHHQVITKSSFSIDEQVLNYLIGLPHLNETLTGLFRPISETSDLVPSHSSLVDQIHQMLLRNHEFSLPAIELYGDELKDKLQVASKLSAKNNMNLYTISLIAIPDNTKEIAELARLWNREVLMGRGALFIDCSENDLHDSGRLHKISQFCDEITGLLIIGCRQWSPALNRHKYSFTVSKPLPKEQADLWRQELGGANLLLDGAIDHVVSQFNMGSQAIRETTLEVKKELNGETIRNDTNEKKLVSSIWSACCKQNRPGLDELAQRIVPVAGWDDIVLPDLQKQTLFEIAAHVRHRVKVYNDWGFGAKSSRGLGISVLFIGESGTGKTMAAEILANALKLDLYRIDLSQVVNKYIGETEKNLRKVFDAAESGGAVLLFDEADALFGKRSEVRDSHDRYANIEVSYLLQRMEAYQGLAILTTNLKTAMDKAFLRRLRFVVQFPFPDAGQRAKIWSKTFPAETPLEGIDVNRLSRMNITGGNIRNIALNAAFIAAESNGAVKMEHIEKAARYEYAKMEKPLSTSEKLI